MKHTLIISLIFIATICNAQNWKRGLAVVGYHTACVALGAVADGLYDEGHKEWSHALHATEIAAVIGGPFIFKPKGSNEIVAYLASYGFIRLSLFDSFYNMTRDLPPLYAGSTSTYDKVVSGIPPDGRAVIKSWSLVIGIAIPIKTMR